MVTCDFFAMCSAGVTLSERLERNGVRQKYFDWEKDSDLQEFLVLESCVSKGCIISRPTKYLVVLQRLHYSAHMEVITWTYYQRVI